jgi:hypothetical protein
MRLRNSHPAFDGELEVNDSPDHILSLRRINGPAQAVLTADLRTHDFQIILCENGEQKIINFDQEV